MIKSTNGFTIVELVVVMVMVTLLAAVTASSFIGVQNNASDSAVKADLSALKTLWQKFYKENTKYPSSGSEVNTVTANFKVTKSGYAVAPSAYNNLIICFDQSNSQRFSIAARSRSGNMFYISDAKSITNYTGAWTSQDVICQQALPGWTFGDYTGYVADDTTTGPWRSWTGGNN